VATWAEFSGEWVLSWLQAAHHVPPWVVAILMFQRSEEREPWALEFVMIQDVKSRRHPALAAQSFGEL
jgi:hypothetical protein